MLSTAQIALRGLEPDVIENADTSELSNKALLSLMLKRDYDRSGFHHFSAYLKSIQTQTGCSYSALHNFWNGRTNLEAITIQRVKDLATFFDMKPTKLFELLYCKNY